MSSLRAAICLMTLPILENWARHVSKRYKIVGKKTKIQKIFPDNELAAGKGGRRKVKKYTPAAAQSSSHRMFPQS